MFKSWILEKLFNFCSTFSYNVIICVYTNAIPPPPSRTHAFFFTVLKKFNKGHQLAAADRAHWRYRPSSIYRSINQGLLTPERRRWKSAMSAAGPWTIRATAAPPAFQRTALPPRPLGGKQEVDHCSNSLWVWIFLFPLAWIYHITLTSSRCIASCV